MATKGYVYVMFNRAMPKCLKVGFTTKSSTLRAKQFDGPGVPFRYHVVYDVFVEDPRALEQAAHAMLAPKRECKEWFRCSEEDAIAAIKACAKNPSREQYYSKHERESEEFWYRQRNKPRPKPFLFLGKTLGWWGH